MNSSLQPSASKELGERFRSAYLFAVALFGTALVGLAAWSFFSALNGNASHGTQKFQFASWYQPLIKPEPVENYTFIVAVTSGILFLSIAAYRSLTKQKETNLIHKIVLMLAVVGVTTFIALIRWDSIFSEPPTDLVSASIRRPALFSLITLGVAASAWRLMQEQIQNAAKMFLTFIGCAIPLAVLSSTVLLSNYDEAVVGWHYEVFVYPIVQDWLGHALTINQKSQYGLYPIFLRPIWFLFGAPTSIAITSTMSMLMFVSNAAVVAFMYRFNRHKSLAIIFGLLAIFYTALAIPFWPRDPYFQFFPVRQIFPAFSLLMMFRQSENRFVSYCVLAAGLLWNFESGIVAFAAFAVYVLALQWSQNPSRLLPFAGRQLILSIIAVAVVICLFVGYYIYRFGAPPSPERFFLMFAVFASGYGAEPMPLFGGWFFHALIYASAVFVGFRRLRGGINAGEKRQAAALLAMATMGIIWLRYYQGRSVAIQLMLVSLPAICCLGFLVDVAIGHYFRNTTKAVGDVISITLGAPLAAVLVVWLLGNPLPYRKFPPPLAGSDVSQLDLLTNRIVNEFELRKKNAEDQLLVVSPIAHLVQMKLGMPNPLDFTGMRQIILQSEIDQLASVLSSSHTKMLVLNDPRIADDPKIRQILDSSFEKLALESECRLGDPAFNWRYVRRDGNLQTSAAPDRLVNVAFGKAAEQSSSLGGARPELVVDGNTEGDFNSGSASHTNLEVNPWWQVDLGTETEIDSIKIWNRTDCCSERLKNFWVFVSDQPFKAGAPLSELENDSSITKRFELAQPCPSTSVDIPNVRGRYIRVQTKGNNYLSLAEVQVLSRVSGEEKAR